MITNGRRAGWTTVRLGDAVNEISTRIDNPSEAEADRFVGLEHFDSGELKIRRWGTTADLISAMKLFKAGDTLFARRNAYLRRASMVDFDGVCSGDAIVLRPKESVIIGELLPAILNTDTFWDYALSHAAGSMSKRVNIRNLLSYEFALPPIEEQKRIAELLWAAEGAVETIRSCYEPLEALDRNLLLSTFRSSFSSPEWKKYEIRELGDLKLGRQKSEKYMKGLNPMAYLKVSNVSDGRLVLDKVEQMDFTSKEMETYRLLPGDVVMSEGDLVSEFNVGRSALFRGEVDDCAFQNHLIRFRPRSGLLPDFALALFRFLYHSHVFAKMAKKTTVVSLGVQRVAPIPVAVPEIGVQSVIAMEMAAVAEAEDRVKAQEAVLVGVKAQLLFEAFSHDV